MLYIEFRNHNTNKSTLHFSEPNLAAPYTATAAPVDLPGNVA